MHLHAPILFPIPRLSREDVVREMRVRKNVKAGFSLVELLVVMGIMAILASIALVSVSGVKSSRDLYKAAYDVQGALEQARTYAMANDTYTWVGFFEEDPNTPGVAGTGQVVISTIASASGTNPEVVGNPVSQSLFIAPGLIQVAKLMKVPNTHLAVLTAAQVPTRNAATIPANTYQVASASFANTTTFPYPLTGTAQYTFSRIVQFSPQGDATRIADNPALLMEIGLQPSHGDQLGATGANFAAIQISGIGGQVITYRP